jgi:hypothetical protein
MIIDLIIFKADPIQSNPLLLLSDTKHPYSQVLQQI